jgi:nitrogen regulatory protein PII
LKLVTAILRPEILDKVREALCDVDIPGMTVTEVKVLANKKVTPNNIEAQSLLLNLSTRSNLKLPFLLKI